MTNATTAAPARVTRRATLAALLTWWLALATLLWVCFLRPEARGLSETVAWFSGPAPLPIALATAFMLSSALLMLRGRPALAVPGLLVGLALALLNARSAFGP